MRDGYPVGLTEDDVAPSAPLTFVVGPAVGWAGLLGNVQGATGLPGWGSKARDRILRESVALDGMWASAVNMAITKHVALGYQVADSQDSGRRLSNAQALVKSYGSRGLAQGLRDYLTTNAGQFVGVLRAGGRSAEQNREERKSAKTHDNTFRKTQG